MLHHHPGFMRLIYLSLLFVLSTIGHGYAQGKNNGIIFFAGTWKELLAEAGAKNLPVFIDVYTDWCVPCKRMEKEIFVLPEVGEFYNDHFICYRLNAEKGEGPSLAVKYGVSAYPTWLYLDKDGSMRTRRTDYLEAGAFIDAGKEALYKDSASYQLTAFEKRFKQGERGKTFLHNYLELRTKFQLDNAEVLNAYVAVLQNATPTKAEINFLLLNAGRTWSAAIPRIANSLHLFDSSEQKEMANHLFDEHLYFAWGNAVKEDDTSTAKKSMTAGEKIYPLLSKEKQLTYNRTALFHCRKLMLRNEMKKFGYRIAVPQMEIDKGFAQQQDKILFDKVMQPFISGAQDSSKIAGFAEERALAARQYSGNIASLLYEVAMAFADLLPANDPALNDAATWAVRADSLAPNQYTNALVKRLLPNAVPVEPQH